MSSLRSFSRLALPLTLAGAVFALGACGDAETAELAELPPGATPVTVSEGTSMSVAVSPDGERLAIDLQGTIWVLPAEGGEARAVTDAFNDARQPVWSPDGEWIAYQGYRDGDYDIWLVEEDGGSQRKLTSGRFDDREPAWSHDGTRVAFASDREGQSGNYDIWMMNEDGSNLVNLTDHPAQDTSPAWSPDGKKLAFVSTRHGGSDIHLLEVK